MSLLGVGVVGAAGWGSNVVRAFSTARGAALRWVCDLNGELLTKVAASYPGVRVTRKFDEMLADPDVTGVAVAVDAANHHAIALKALQAGRHVLVEKPLTLSGADAAQLCQVAAQAGLTLMVGHLLLYHPAVVRTKAIIDAGDLGDVLYLYSQRVNLGIVRDNENAWWSLAPHDIAVALHLLGGFPSSVSATGATFLQRDRQVEDIAFAALRFPDDRVAHIHVSWLDPHKRRSLTVVGSKKMLTFDDAAPDEKVKIYDKGASPRPGHTTYAEGVVIRSGDVHSPALPLREPLLVECEHFVDCVRNGKRPLSDGSQGLAVVKVLEAGALSIREGGRPMSISL
jgi:predicted dehydrogenase